VAVFKERQERKPNLSELFLLNMQSLQFGLYLGKSIAMFRLDLFCRGVQLLAVSLGCESILGHMTQTKF